MKNEKSPPDYPVILFEQQQDWMAWLDTHHQDTAGVWLQLTKKASGIPSVSYAEALDVALCYGWIDGQKKSYNETSWLQKFTPRSPRSIWSKVNREKVRVLIERGMMRQAGLQEVERAKQDGRWDAAYDSPKNATIPDDFQAALDNHPPAKDFFGTLNSQNRYAMLFRIQTAKKAETRAKRIQQFIDMLVRQEKIYP